MPEGPIFPKLAESALRRIVTGVDEDGKSVVARIEPLSGDPRALLLWGADVPPQTGCADTPVIAGWWPPPGGVRVSLSTRAPDHLATTTRPDLPDINDAAGFHASASTDVIITIAGPIWLELDDGVEIQLDTGDVLIQNGTRHRWQNHGTHWPVIAVVIVGAQPR
ncbi:hypothetical protein [Blastomonas fulva]|uniref:hypothetical protein n=1 Tax=Blastomonas fulva TaxID=1550728 RepID=UPI003F72C1C2